MAAEGSDIGPQATAPPPLPKRRKIEPPRRTRPSQVTLDKDKSAAYSSSTVSGVLPVRVDLNKVKRQRALLSFKRSMRDALEAIKALIPSLGITLFLSSQATTSLIRLGQNDEQEWQFVRLCILNRMIPLILATLS
ncbi:unnamed protein product [Urochloa humidicola]